MAEMRDMLSLGRPGAVFGRQETLGQWLSGYARARRRREAGVEAIHEHRITERGAVFSPPLKAIHRIGGG
jgi:hypothetical protein